MSTSLIAPVAAVLSTLPNAWPEQVAWQPLTHIGAPIGDTNGEAGPGGETDLVGDDANSAGAWSADLDVLYLRMRLDDDPSEALSEGYFTWSFLFALDGETETYDVMATIGRCSADRTGVFVLENDHLYDDTLVWVDFCPDQGEPIPAAFEVVPADSYLKGDRDAFLDVRFPRASLPFLHDDTAFRVALATGLAVGASVDFAGEDGDTDELAPLFSDPVVLDQDADDLFAFEEDECGSDPAEADSDGDGLDDFEECANGFDPRRPDTDGDGVGDRMEYTCLGRFPGGTAADRDGDTVSDAVEGTADTDRDGLYDFCDLDSDGDDRADADERFGDADCDDLPDRVDAVDDDACEAVEPDGSAEPSTRPSHAGCQTAPERLSWRWPFLLVFSLFVGFRRARSSC